MSGALLIVWGVALFAGAIWSAFHVYSDRAIVALMIGSMVVCPTLITIGVAKLVFP